MPAGGGVREYKHSDRKRSKGVPILQEGPRSRPKVHTWKSRLTYPKKKRVEKGPGGNFMLKKKKKDGSGGRVSKVWRRGW